MFFVNIFISLATIAAGFNVNDGAASATSSEALFRVAAHAVLLRRCGSRVLRSVVIAEGLEVVDCV